MKVEIELPDPPEAPKNHTLLNLGFGNEDIKHKDYFVWNINKPVLGWQRKINFPATRCKDYYYIKVVRTHRDKDRTPLEIDPIPKMPDNVERVEYFGSGMKPKDMGDADNYIFYCGFKWHGLLSIEQGFSSKHPNSPNMRYARVWYKKVEKKTKLTDLLGDDYQKTAYLIKEDGTTKLFDLSIGNGGAWSDLSINQHFLAKNYRWSHSPVTKFEDANPFVF